MLQPIVKLLGALGVGFGMDKYGIIKAIYIFPVFKKIK